MAAFLTVIAILAVCNLAWWLLRGRPPTPRCRCGHEKTDHIPSLLGPYPCDVRGCDCKDYGTT